jgi:NADH-quinone oxidoreductase subunit G
LNAAEMLSARLKAYVLVGGIEGADLAPGAATEASLRGAECVVAITPYASDEVLANASVILPSAVFAETSGTWVNVEGRWQSVAGAAKPPGEARPAWKILRVLGNLLGLAGFEYVSSEEVRDELRHELDSYRGGVATAALFAPGRLAAVDATRDVGLYGVDAIVRRSAPLQATADGLAGQGGAA